MGCGQSSSTAAPRPVATAAVPQEPKYAGPPVTYNIVNIDVPHEAQTGLAFGPQVEFKTLTGSIYLPALTNMYDLGFRMSTFNVSPGSMTASGFVSLKMETKLKTQGIFHKVSDEEKGKWKLCMEKSCLPQQVFATGLLQIGGTVTSQPTHIFQTIEKLSVDGGRLISIEVTGGSFSGASAAPAATMGMGAQPSMSLYGHSPNTLLCVDIFYDMPTTPGGEKYTYQIVPAQMSAVLKTMTGAIGGSWSVTFDWANIVGPYLSQGWKLVEVFLDQNNKSFSDRAFMASKITSEVGAMFIFEKPLSKINDNTPVYEAKMVEYKAPGKMKMTGIGKTTIEVNANWDSVIAQEGQNGWEIVRILQTPATIFKQSLSMTPEFGWMHFIYFQRKIMTAAPEPELQKTDEPPAPVMPPQQQESS
ncbi:uncharacterized protein LOC110450491 [Mizuhopecten yessoensis]|uniref:Uncharacterized protein n=1 Tax=Mizuhopecten yessoensis TaxID=6573 RepID=A0A210QNV2_MIZYE|nr:uncharacterized protein LOC110450491 [Mizuhopecten yessoensis]OWF50409.1 hypothetical protein KP79_PYT09438 [Mizuhopecten yessoensis]